MAWPHAPLGFRTFTIIPGPPNISGSHGIRVCGLPGKFEVMRGHWEDYRADEIRFWISPLNPPDTKQNSLCVLLECFLKHRVSGAMESDRKGHLLNINMYKHACGLVNVHVPHLLHLTSGGHTPRFDVHGYMKIHVDSTSTAVGSLDFHFLDSPVSLQPTSLTFCWGIYSTQATSKSRSRNPP